MNDRKTMADIRVLIADDSPCIQRLLAYTIESSGAQAIVVENGREAVDRALADDDVPIDVILMDIQMPILDGYCATRELRASGFTRPIIALTADSESSTRQKCLDAGCDDFATKPIDRKQLVELVLAACNGDAASCERSSQAVDDGCPATEESPREDYEYLDVAAAMQRLGGDTEFFADMAETFLQFQNEYLTDIGKVVGEQNASELRRIAHGLKGAISDFTTGAPYQTAFALEKVGESSDLSEAVILTEILAGQVLTLCDDLQKYIDSTRGVHASEIVDAGLLPSRKSTLSTSVS